MKFLKQFPLAIIFGLLIGIGFSYWTERPYLTYENLPFPTSSTRVKAGETVPLTVRRCNSSKVVQVYSVTHSLESVDRGVPNVVLPPNEHVSIAPGCTTGLSLINQIPKEVPPGHYRIAGMARIDSFFGERWIPWFSEVFEVV